MQFKRRIQDFPEGAPSIISKNFAENCMKMKKIGLKGGTKDAHP